MTRWRILITRWVLVISLHILFTPLVITQGDIHKSSGSCEENTINIPNQAWENVVNRHTITEKNLRQG